MKRFTPEEDVDRLSERVWNWAHGNIADKEDFDAVFDDYMGEMNHKQETKLRSEVWEKLSGKRRLRQKPKRRHKVRKTEKRPTHKFKSVGKVKRKVVYARRDYVFIKGKKRTIFRDKQGRFVSTKRKK